ASLVARLPSRLPARARDAPSGGRRARPVTGLARGLELLPLVDRLLEILVVAVELGRRRRALHDRVAAAGVLRRRAGVELDLVQGLLGRRRLAARSREPFGAALGLALLGPLAVSCHRSSRSGPRA